MATLFDSIEDIKEIFIGDSVNSIEDIRDGIEKDIKSGKPSRPPLYVMMKTTNRCNSNCIYCNHAANKIGAEQKEQISTNRVLEIIDEAGELGVKAMSISGGEPLLRDDVELFVERMKQHNILPVLLTNGMLLKNRLQSLYESGLRYFIISIDSLEDETFFKQRGVHLKSIMEGLDELTKLREKDSSIKIHVTTVVTAKNISEMPSLVKELSSRKIPVQLNPYHDFYKIKGNELNTYDEEETKKTVKKLIKMRKEGYLIANSEKFLRHFTDFFNKKKNVPDNYNCLVSYVSIYIDTYQNVLPCWSDCFSPVGNLKESSLEEIWYGEKYAQCRKKMYECKCEGCWFLCTGELTILLDGDK